MKNEQNDNENNSKYPIVNEVNYGASTSSEVNQEAKTTQNQIKSNNVNRIALTPEQVAVEQILLVNKMYAIQMVKYWQS